MSDPYKTVSPGERLRIPARAWNELLAMREAGYGTAVDYKPASQTVLVRNDSGTAREQFEILGLADPIILPTDDLEEFKSRVAFSGITPDATVHATKFVILQEPLAAGAIGRAIVDGVAITKITVSGSSLDWAAPETGSYKLINSDNGSARILWIESSGATRWAVIVSLSNMTATAGAMKWLRFSGDPITADVGNGKPGYRGMITDPITGGDGAWCWVQPSYLTQDPGGYTDFARPSSLTRWLGKYVGSGANYLGVPLPIYQVENAALNIISPGGQWWPSVKRLTVGSFTSEYGFTDGLQIFGSVLFVDSYSTVQFNTTLTMFDIGTSSSVDLYCYLNTLIVDGGLTVDGNLTVTGSVNATINGGTW